MASHEDTKARIALATAAHLPHCSEDDQVLIAAMRAAGLEPVPVIWDEPADWRAFDVIVLRSIWDYHLKYPRFLQWLDELDATGVPVFNPTDVVRWNADKRYMLELESRGIRITPTRLATADHRSSLESIAAETGWQHLVIKPTVASTGYETWMTDAPVDATAEQRFRDQTARMDVLVQEFARGVHAGEMSLVFLNGSYSHSVLKRAAGDEFRVHIEHGGTVETVMPSAEQIAWAQSVIDAIPQSWVYARVDAVNDEAGPMVMELELLDPELFFHYETHAADRLIAAITSVNSAR
jgi:glutathione synthase/RimK-type ligase-like ATP-grasp enzyme